MIVNNNNRNNHRGKMSVAFTTLSCARKLNLVHSNIAIFTQLRWRKAPKRKPRWLPMAQSKVFRIPVHPHVPPDERELVEDLLDEYYRKVESLRIIFKDEVNQKPNIDEIILDMKKEEEEEFKLLLEENKKENERMRKIREETLEKEFQEQQLQWLQMEEAKQQELQETKLRIEEIVKAEKASSMGFITLENIDQVIENAIDNPVNLSFTITLDGTVNWEGKPSLEYEEDIHRRVEKSREA